MKLIHAKPSKVAVLQHYRAVLKDANEALAASLSELDATPKQDRAALLAEAMTVVEHEGRNMGTYTFRNGEKL